MKTTPNTRQADRRGGVKFAARAGRAAYPATNSFSSSPKLLKSGNARLRVSLIQGEDHLRLKTPEFSADKLCMRRDFLRRDT